MPRIKLTGVKRVKHHEMQSFRAMKIAGESKGTNSKYSISGLHYAHELSLPSSPFSQCNKDQKDASGQSPYTP